MKKTVVVSLILVFVGVIYACRKAEPFADENLDERMSGGDATVFDDGAGAFGHAISGLSARDEKVHDIGDKMFEATFVSAPAPLYAGLGPVYNSRNCISCHIADGRGRPPLAGEAMQSMLLKLTPGGVDEHGAPLGLTGFGGQLQDKAISGAQPEGSANMTWLNSTETLADGTVVPMRKPAYTFTNLYMPLPGAFHYSPRVANPVVGLGLLDAIEEASILRHADIADADGDGISGKPNYVYDYATHQPHILGRFGWKAASTDVRNQVVKALNQDMGITTSVFTRESAHGQKQMENVPVQQPYDLHDTMVTAIVFYVKTLAVPARRNVADPIVKKGQLIFKESGCVKCHVDVHITKTDVTFKPLSGQVIRPYTDLLLHDMGPELADGFSEFDADGNEWRTPALWGLGLTQKVSGHTYLLHDGRARNITEAILWHGGEADASKQRFRNLPAPDREALLKFLNSL